MLTREDTIMASDPRLTIAEAVQARRALPEPVPHRLVRTDDPDVTEVLSLDRRVRLGSVVRRTLDSGAHTWLPTDLDGARVPGHCVTRADAGTAVARTEQARAAVQAHRARSVLVVREDGSWRVSGAGVADHPTPLLFRTRRAAYGWCEARGLAVT